MKMIKNALFAVLMGTSFVALTTTACGSSASTEKESIPETEIPLEVMTTETDDQIKTVQATEDKNDKLICSLYPLASAEDALADGGYSVGFEAKDLVKGENGYELTVEVYEYDRYEKEAIDNLESGDQIQVCNEVIDVESVERNPEYGYISINGGIENNGIELTEDDGLYRTVTMNDYPVYYVVGTISIPLADDMTFEDHEDWEKEPDGVVSDVEGLKEALENENGVFCCNNTVVTVRQEKIVQVIRYWVP